MEIERLGVGLQHNPEISEWFPFESQNVPVMEFLVDSVMGPLDSPQILRPGAAEFLERLGARYRLLAHSNYGCEFGFDDLLKTPAVRRHVEISKLVRSPWVVDHCFYGDSSWVDIWSSPIQFSKSEVRRIGDRAKALQDLYGVPLAHENAAYYLTCPGSTMREAEFLSKLVDYAGTWLLLDLHNVYANSQNFVDYDAMQVVNELPIERVLEVHLSGGSWCDGMYHDWHDSPVPEPVWELLELVLQRHLPAAVVLEFQGRAHHGKTRILEAGDDEMFIVADIARAQRLWSQYANGTSGDEG